jgi:hypothetical protein
MAGHTPAWYHQMMTISDRTTYLFLADLILILHVAVICFMVLGFLFIWIGYFRNWSFVRNFYFRMAHLLVMGAIVIEALGGLICPLTDWEYRLRILGGQKPGAEDSFVGFWLHRLFFFDLSPAAFTMIYATFFLAFLLTLWKIKPRRPWKREDHFRNDRLAKLPGADH